MKKVNKLGQDHKMQVEAIKKNTNGGNPGNANPMQVVGNYSINNRIKAIEKRFSGVDGSLENIDTVVKRF